MREVNDPDRTEQPLATGGWLHFDALAGASGEMVVGALLDLGLPIRVVDEAFARADLISLGVRAERTTRAGRTGTFATFVDGQGRALRPTERAHRSPPRARRAGRRRGPATHPDRRLEHKAAVAHLAEGEEGEGGADAEVLAGPEGDLGGPVPAAGAVARWLSGQPARASEVEGRLKGASLRPLEKAIAYKALRRLLAARAEDAGQSPDEHELAGPEAVHLLCTVIAFGALLDALAPARVTSTPVLVEMGADSVVLAVLAGARIREEELDFVPTSPLGAALLWAVCHRFGPRGDLVPERAGRGHGPVLRRGRVHATTASVGPVDDPARMGEALLEVRARVPGDVEPSRLAAGLAPKGATQVTVRAVVSARGPGIEVVCTVPRADLRDVAHELWRRGASSVRALEAEVLAPSEREVTVAVGRGNKKVPVRVVEVFDAGELLWREPQREDLAEAAARLSWPTGVVRDEALALAADRARERESNETK